MADITGKPFAERTKEFFYQNIKHVDSRSIRDAAQIFAAKGHFPTLNEFLIECGYRPLKTKTETRDLEHKIERAKALNQEHSSSITPENAFGDMSWEVRVVTESDVDANHKFEEARARLHRAGWKITGETQHECQTEVGEGRKVRGARLMKIIFSSTKPEPEIPKFVDRKTRSTGGDDE